jgi:hypothetical protein
MTPIREKERAGVAGAFMLLLGLALLFSVPAIFVNALPRVGPGDVGFALFDLIAAWIVLGGLVMVNPNEAVVLQLFGGYVGTLKTAGLRWTNPFYKKTRLSVRASSFESTHLKVNDRDGNPIEIAAIIVMRVKDTAQAVFAVNDYAGYVRTQAEASLRNLASRHPYDAHDDALSLRRNTDEMAVELRRELEGHVGATGVEVVDAKISHLAYAPEIAQAMLQRQQASAIIAARQKIVEGAVGMVQMALEKLKNEGVVTLDEERKAQMVSNLLVVLCSERAAQPIINSGTIYS